MHLIGHRPEVEPIPDSSSDPAKTGRLDHIAFACAGLKDMKATLEPEEAAAKAIPIFLGDQQDEEKLTLIDYEGNEWPW